MLVNKAIKIRLYPNAQQLELINKTFGCCRFVYNQMLDLWNSLYILTGKGSSYYEVSRLLPILKDEFHYPFLKEVDSTALQRELKYLHTAFDNFYIKKAKFPTFKRKGDKDSFTSVNVNNSIKIKETSLQLPKLKNIKCSRHLDLSSKKINSVTVTKTSSGKIIASIQYEDEVCSLPKTNQFVGIDLGLHDFCILSNGEKFKNHKFLHQTEIKLHKEQRKLSRMYEQAKRDKRSLKDSKNFQKQKIKVARLHEKIANQRSDYLDKLSIQLVREYDIIYVEDIHTKGILKNHKLAKSVTDVAWNTFLSKLEYKCLWYGKILHKIDRWYPSTQICHVCGHIDGKKLLSIRKWECSSCHAIHDRDVNAAINILNEGLRTLSIVG